MPTSIIEPRPEDRPGARIRPPAEEPVPQWRKREPGDNFQERRVVLVGAGHAHMLLLKKAWKFREIGQPVAVVDPGSFWYSAMATGMVGGRYSRQQMMVPPERKGLEPWVEFFCDQVTAIDRAQRVVILESGRRLRYELISLNLGSVVPDLGIRDADFYARPAKPLRELWSLRRSLELGMEAGFDELKVVVLGGGATGCEIAANLRMLGKARAIAIHVTLATMGRRLLGSAPPRASNAVHRHLERLGIRIVYGFQVERAESDRVRSEKDEIRCDAIVLATGLVPPPLMKTLGLPCAADGGLLVDETLRSVADRHVFAVGDCASVEGHDRPRLGVFGVKQAPVLLQNLLRHFSKRKPKRYKPQKRWLSILDLGDEKGLALWGPFWLLDGSMLRYKRWLDQRFIRRIRP